MAARRPYSPAETDIIRSGARAGRAGGAIVEQLLAAGFTRSPAGVLSSAAFAEGRADLERDRKQAQIVSGDAGLRARAAKAEPVTPKFDNASDQIIFESARAGASLDAIAEALQKAGCGNPCLSTISRSAAYREAKGQASAKRVARPWSTREIDIVTDGARQGLSGPALQKALAEIGSIRVLRCITASQYYAKGRQLGRDDTARAALEASTAQAKVISDQVGTGPTLSDQRIVRRHPAFPGVSLPFLAIQKDWGEVIAR